jgi:hypothetical protein
VRGSSQLLLRVFVRLLLHSKAIRTLAVFGLLMGCTVGSPSIASENSDIDQFAGSYTLIQNQSDNPRQAIDQATSTMNFVVRLVARRQLTQKTIPYSTFAMQRSGEFFNTSLPGKPVLSLPLSGSTVLWKAPDGEVVRVRLQAGSELIQVFESKQGRRENRFTLSSDHRLLTMSVKVTSHELPKPVEYRAVYRKS